MTANGGNGGRGGNGGLPLQAYNGVTYGGYGGGGRIALYSGLAVAGFVSSSGSNASGSAGGAPTKTVITATLSNTLASFLPRVAVYGDPGADQPYTLSISPPNISGS